MKRTKMTTGLIAMVFTLLVSSSVFAQKKDIVELAVGNDNLSTLVAAVKAAGLVETLQGNGPYTVFAPTNEAFAKLPEGTVEDLLKPENKEKLQSILKYHVADQKIKGKYLLNGSTEVATLQGGTITIAKNDEGATVNGANILKTDIWGSNGVVHIIDTVILPE